VPPAQRPRWGESRHHRIVFFEKLFITCDTDSNGYMKIKVVERLFSFLALKSSFKERHAILTALDYQGDSLIQQDEFIQVCCQLLKHCTHLPLHFQRSVRIDGAATACCRRVCSWCGTCRKRSLSGPQKTSTKPSLTTASGI
jgi:hypothetical protein